MPRREPAPSSAWGRPLLRDHELAALGCFRLAARKPRLFETRSSARGVRPPYAGIRPFGDGSGNGFGRSSGPDLPAPPPERSCQSPGASAPPSALAEALRLPRLPRTCGRSNRLRMRSRLRCSWARACAFPARTASRRVSWTLFPPWLQVDLSRGAGAPASERKKPLDSATALLRPCLAIRAVAVRFGPIRLLWRTFPQTHKHALWPSALRSRLPGAAWRRVKRLLPWGCRGATALQPRLASGLVEQCFHGYRREGCGCPIRVVAKGLSFMAKEEVGAGGALGAASCEDAMNLSAGFVGWCLVGRAMLEVSEKLLV